MKYTEYTIHYTSKQILDLNLLTDYFQGRYIHCERTLKTPILLFRLNNVEMRMTKTILLPFKI